ncbi:MAG: OmpH family outer membrane protein [Bacteroidota bacterium]
MKKEILFIAIGLVLFFLVPSMIINPTFNAKVGFVNNHLLFEGFNGKKALEARLTEFGETHQPVLDSLELQLTYLYSEIQAGKEDLIPAYSAKELAYKQLSQEFEQKYNAQSQEYMTSIWKQINEYVEAYGEEFQYDYIFGAMGNGNLMYGNREKDLTEEVLKFINEKYEGI